MGQELLSAICSSAVEIKGKPTRKSIFKLEVFEGGNAGVEHE